MKKVLSLVLALALVLAITVPAFATDATLTPNADGTSTAESEITGTTKPATLTVTVPASGTVVVNPYEQEVTTGVKDQIVSTPQDIVNGSDVAVTVSVTVTGTKEGNAVFATAPTQGGTKAVTTNSVFMYLQVLPKPATGSVTWATAYDSKEASLVVVSEKGATKANIVTLGDKTKDTKTASYRLAGDAASSPAKPWTATDTVKVKVAFTFAPTVIAAS